MSKERARLRAEREREQAVKAAARAAEAERQERRASLRRSVTSRLPRRSKAPTGLLAQRRRHELTVTLILLGLLNLVVWLAFPGWAPRLLALLVTVLGAPVLHTLLFRRR